MLSITDRIHAGRRKQHWPRREPCGGPTPCCSLTKPQHPTPHHLHTELQTGSEAQGQTQKAALDPPPYLHCAKHLVLYVPPSKLLLHRGSGGSIQHLQPDLPGQGWHCCHTGAPGTTEVPSAHSHHLTTGSTHLSLSWEHPPRFQLGLIFNGSIPR